MMARRRWLLLAFTVVFVAAGVFFAAQGLDRADQYASVASFLLALTTLVITASARPAPPPAEDTATGTYQVTASHIGSLQVGPGTHATVNTTSPTAGGPPAPPGEEPPG